MTIATLHTYHNFYAKTSCPGGAELRIASLELSTTTGGMPSSSVMADGGTISTWRENTINMQNPYHWHHWNWYVCMYVCMYICMYCVKTILEQPMDTL